ncbi:MAG: TauD/TfdA family dioxygenase [Planctomycetota bacterium]|nr:TauD/TfdA family dioxygenase [Planctomycetota bacterium]
MNLSEFEKGQPVGHESAWRGVELFNSSFWERQVPKNHFSAIDSLDCRQWFLEIQDELENGCGAVLLKGAEVSGVSSLELKNRFLKFCSQIGTPLSQSAKGENVFSVRDEGYGSSDPRTRGPNTRKKLSFHTDRCDVIGFLCLKPAKRGGENQVVSSVALYNAILQQRPELLEVLCEPYYYQRHNVDVGNDQQYIQQPIFSFFRGCFASNFLRVLIDRASISGEVPPMTSRQKEALDYLENLAGDPEFHVTFRQEEGDILLLNNWVTYHRRTEFEDEQAVERRRHLLRVWLAVPNSRPLHPLFKGNYGATEGGAIRGGINAS